MGGGDLNLKKSWHPHTMRNQEKVWKAEQAKTQEERKVKDLQKEIEEEKTREELKRIGQTSGILPQEDKKLEWMYKGSTELVNRDEYLLGRTIDKSFEMLQAEEQRKEPNMVGVKQSINHVEHECIPFSIRAYRNLDSSEQVDLQRKIMEDPLMLIKQREMESRRKILENPVKLKELHRILKSEQMIKKAKKTKKSKKSKSKKSKKKHKKHSKSDTDENSTDTDAEGKYGKDLDKELAKRYKKLNKEEDFAGLNLSKLLDAKFDTITKELDKAAEGKYKSRKVQRSSRSSSNDSNKSIERRRVKEQRGKHRDISPKYQRRRSRSPVENSRRREPHSKSPRECRRRSRSPKDSYRRSRSPRESQRRSRSPRDSHRRSRSPKESHGRSRSPKESHRRSRSPKESHRRSRSPKERHRRSRSPRDSHRRSRSPKESHRRSRSPRDSHRRSKSPRESHRKPRSPSPSRFRTSNHHDQTHNRSNKHEQNSIAEKRSSSSTSHAAENIEPPKSQKKLSDEEKAARLREMMKNAKWREEDRLKSVQKHRDACAREEEQYKSQNFDKEFINKEVKKAIANQSSVGSRIRSNLNNIQRISSAMDSNFARK